MHDLCEGIIPSILELILTSICSKYSLNQSTPTPQKSFAKKIIEQEFQKFDFYEGKPTLSWDANKRNGFKIDGTAVQVNYVKVLSTIYI